MLLHIPHSATKMLDGVQVEELDGNQFALTDWYTDELFFHESAEPIIFPFSRLSVDVERLIVNEPMDKYGMGILYEKDVFGNVIKRTNEDCMEYYNDHHYKLNQAVNKYLSYFKTVFVVDCHSFSEENIMPINHTKPFPDICIGVDEKQTPSVVVKDLVDYFKGFFNNININDPYSGTIVPSWFKGNNNVSSIMIEVNKNLYMDDNGNKNNNFEKIQEILTGALDIIYEYET